MGDRYSPLCNKRGNAVIFMHTTPEGWNPEDPRRWSMMVGQEWDGDGNLVKESFHLNVGWHLPVDIYF